MKLKLCLSAFIINFFLFSFMAFGQESADRIINVDYTQEKGDMNTMFKECVGAGRANEGLRADWQQQLAMIKNDCDFQFIRMHGLLTDDMGVYREDENGNSQYNYQYIDKLYDAILSIGMKPFVELGFMPQALASGNKTVFWWKGNITPPKNYEKWKNLIQNLTQHFTKRYGEEEVKTWYFEVWNEPNLKDGFWSGTMDEYFKLYKNAVEGIKNVNADYKVGGPATAGAAWVPEMIQYCTKNDVPVDFISTHSYGVEQGYLDETGTSGTILSKNEWSVSGDVLRSRKQISESKKPGLELHYTEWSSSYTPSDPIHDSYHEAAFILQKLKQVGDTAQSMSYWTFTDIFEEAGPRFTPFHGGFGLLNYQGIKKPAYFAYEFLNKLGRTELQNSDTSSWATKSDNGDFQVLFWNYTNTHPGKEELNQTYYIKDLPAKPKGSISVKIDKVPQGKYAVKLYKVGYEANDAFDMYLAMGKPNQLTKAQVETLKEEASGRPSKIEIIDVSQDGEVSKEIEMRENDVFLLEFVKL